MQVYIYLVANTITKTWNFQMPITFLPIIRFQKFKILQNQQKFFFSVFFFQTFILISLLLKMGRSGHENHTEKKGCPYMDNTQLNMKSHNVISMMCMPMERKKKRNKNKINKNNANLYYLCFSFASCFCLCCHSSL